MFKAVIRFFRSYRNFNIANQGKASYFSNLMSELENTVTIILISKLGYLLEFELELRDHKISFEFYLGNYCSIVDFLRLRGINLHISCRSYFFCVL